MRKRGANGLLLKYLGFCTWSNLGEGAANGERLDGGLPVEIFSITVETLRAEHDPRAGSSSLESGLGQVAKDGVGFWLRA